MLLSVVLGPGGELRRNSRTARREGLRKRGALRSAREHAVSPDGRPSRASVHREYRSRGAEEHCHENDVAMPFFARSLEIRGVPFLPPRNPWGLTCANKGAVLPVWGNETPNLQTSCVFWHQYAIFVTELTPGFPRRGPDPSAAQTECASTISHSEKPTRAVLEAPWNRRPPSRGTNPTK